MPTVRLGEDHPQPSHGPDTDTPLTEVLDAVKPRLRGWLHAGMAPLALAGGIVLICLAATPAGVIGGRSSSQLQCSSSASAAYTTGNLGHPRYGDPPQS